MIFPNYLSARTTFQPIPFKDNRKQENIGHSLLYILSYFICALLYVVMQSRNKKNSTLLLIYAESICWQIFAEKFESEFFMQHQSLNKK